MKLIINDKITEVLDSGPVPNLSALVNYLLDSEVIPEGEVVASIEIDGRPVDPLEEDLEGFALNPKKVKTIAIKTESVGDLLGTAIQDGRDSCLALEQDCKTAAEKFRDIDVAAAAEFFSELSGRIMTVLEYLSELHQYIQAAAEGSDVDHYEKIRSRFQTILKEAIASQEQADWVTLADLLEYEFTDIFSEFADYLDAAQVNPS